MTTDSKRDELVLRRVIDAPRTLVFAAFTDPKHLEKWWGPHGFTSPMVDVDARPGGAMNIDMRSPDGVTYPGCGTYREVVEPERIVFTSGLTEGGVTKFEVLNTITLVDLAGKTELTLHARVLSQTPGMEAHLDGMAEGWSQSLEKLATHLST
jgi:uncharacterized protein YndB with AHSA1/START domain